MGTAIATSRWESIQQLWMWRAHDLCVANRGRATDEAGVDSRMALSIAPFMMGSCEMEHWRD